MLYARHRKVHWWLLAATALGILVSGLNVPRVPSGFLREATQSTALLQWAALVGPLACSYFDANRQLVEQSTSRRIPVLDYLSSFAISAAFCCGAAIAASEHLSTAVQSSALLLACSMACSACGYGSQGCVVCLAWLGAASLIGTGTDGVGWAVLSAPISEPSGPRIAAAVIAAAVLLCLACSMPSHHKRQTRSRSTTAMLSRRGPR